jgi:uncharacterized protein (DUF2384 family)
MVSETGGEVEKKCALRAVQPTTTHLYTTMLLMVSVVILEVITLAIAAENDSSEKTVGPLKTFGTTRGATTDDPGACGDISSRG